MADKEDARKAYCSCLFDIASLTQQLDFAELLVDMDKMWKASKEIDLVGKQLEKFEKDCNVDLLKSIPTLKKAQDEFVKFIDREATEESIKIAIDEVGVQLLYDLGKACA